MQASLFDSVVLGFSSLDYLTVCLSVNLLCMHTCNIDFVFFFSYLCLILCKFFTESFVVSLLLFQLGHTVTRLLPRELKFFLFNFCIFLLFFQLLFGAVDLSLCATLVFCHFDLKTLRIAPRRRAQTISPAICKRQTHTLT